MRKWLSFLALFTMLLGGRSQWGGRIYLRDFLVRNSSLVGAGGKTISSGEFHPRGWFPCRVPSTVLNCLVKNGIYPDPYTGLNNLEIPDSSEPYNLWYGLLRFSHLPSKTNPWRSPYWFRTEFHLEKIRGNYFHLVLEGINYRADVWLNGRKVADHREAAGMFRRLRFNITDFVREGENHLAIKIHPLDFPGLPSLPYRRTPNGGLTGDIGKNVTMQCSVGWDWIPPVRDRNMGIWGKVYIERTGPVVVLHPRIITDLPLPKTSPAKITISAEVENLSERTVRGYLRISMGRVRLKKKVVLKPFEKKKLVFSPEQYRSLIIQHPRLWWPSGYGKPDLYTLHLDSVRRGRLSDFKRLKFGIREISTRFVYVKGWARREFFVNGKKIFIRGGAWVPDMMLRRSPERIYRELLLIKRANLNLVRIWGGGVTPPDEFFDACDRLGLLVWHDFWITGDCQGTWGKGSKDWPLEPKVFLKNAEDVVLRLRNHPSLLVWTGGNEGYPGRRIYLPLRNEIVAKLDGTRPFLPSSGLSQPPEEWGLSLPDNGPSGVYSGGPYDWKEPQFYFEKADEGKDWLFKDEVGTFSMPSLNSLAKFITDFTPDPTSDIPFFNAQWRYHFAPPDLKGVKPYGEPQTLQDLVLKSQLAAVEAYRAMFEAVNTHPESISGIMLWKLNPAWPELRWQIYDYFLKPIPAYYYIKKAASMVHIQLDFKNYQVGVMNHLPRGMGNLRAEIKVYDENLRNILERKKEFNISGEEYRRLFNLKDILKEGFHFVKLSLRDSKGKLLSGGFYWVSPERDFSPLSRLKRAKIAVKPVFSSKSLSISIKNESDQLAFFINLSLLKGKDRKEVLPVYWEDNWFSLLPGEERIINARFEEKPDSRPLFLLVEGWNLYPLEAELETGREREYRPEVIFPRSFTSGKEVPVCFKVKNPVPSGERMLSFPVWLKTPDGRLLIHVGLKGGAGKTLCVLTSGNKG